MANPWFRIYSEIQDNVRVQRLPVELRWHFVMLLCSRCKTAELDDDTISFQWRMPLDEVLEIKRVFIAARFIDENWNVLSWNKRQFLSDNVTTRTRKVKERAKERAKEQHGNVPGNPPDTDTEQSAETWEERRYEF